MTANVPDAEPLPMDSDISGFIHIGHLGYAKFINFYIQPLFAGLFGSTPLIEDHAVSPVRYGEPRNDPLEIIKNVFNLAPVFPCGADFIVNEHICSFLRREIKADFREVKIAAAFYFPYQLGEDVLDKIPADFQDYSPDAIKYLAKKYACRAPEERFFQVINPVPDFYQDEYSDFHAMIVAKNAPAGSSIWPKRVIVSSAMLEEYGMVSSWGFQCRSGVYELLRPYLYGPWYWASKYRYF